MKKILSILLIAATIATLCSCSVLTDLKNEMNNVGNNIVPNGSNTLKDFFNQGLNGLEGLLGHSIIEASGVISETEANVLHIYEDKLILSLSTENTVKKMQESGVTIDSIKKERENANTAQMEYKLLYQYCVALNVNESSKVAVCEIEVTEDKLNKSVEITIPIAKESMGVTVYQLLQGDTIETESCLKHGTDTTNICNENFYVQTLPEGKTGTLLVLKDHRQVSDNKQS
jgi:hypothetical protein